MTKIKYAKREAAEVQFLVCAEEGGFKVLEAYSGMNTPIMLECPNGHKRPKRPASLLTGSKCIACVGRCPIQSKEDLLVLVEKEGYFLLGEYVDNKTKIPSICPQGHQYELLPGSFKSGKRCKVCRGLCPKTVKEQFLAYVKSQEYEVLGTYVHNDKPLLLRCPYSHEFEMRPHNFKAGQRCPVCQGQCSVAAKKSFYNSVRKAGYKVLDEYVNNSTPLTVLCPHQHTYKVRPANFKRGQRCAVCKGLSSKVSKEEFFRLLDDESYQAVGDYLNNHTKVDLICRNGHDYAATPKDFKNGVRCSICMGRCPKAAAVKFEELTIAEGFKLLDPYVNSKQTVRMECPRGHEFSMRPNCFLSGQRCNVCWVTEGRYQYVRQEYSENNPGPRGIVYLLKLGSERIKVGFTKAESNYDRVRTIERQSKESVELLYKWTLDTCYEAIRFEEKIHHILGRGSEGPHSHWHPHPAKWGGRYECFDLYGLIKLVDEEILDGTVLEKVARLDLDVQAII